MEYTSGFSPVVLDNNAAVAYHFPFRKDMEHNDENEQFRDSN
jgi:hypothetical protein